MGRPVVHFEITGRDGQALRSFYTRLFDWQIDADNPMGYGMVAREGNTTEDGVGIGGGIAGMPEGEGGGYVTFYVSVPDVEATLTQVESLGGSRALGPEKISDDLVIGQFRDPEGNLIGVIQAMSQSA
ncbi:VOC family protein [Thermasporomyces composti]|jgi:predicted enzyme related to lactoylglutathione lyase|uniref:VOC domain-containing protein n=1 Tax=Thermasporomyces composti TaxID=696763 RepID=A0A3D9V229_THECX|nr:VOC family protein [Thermasporomyces composti]REF35842.1 hypothetical protein DFJ64_1234 [Thermasporomyces composti]